jgi:hypothetical protein
MVKKRRGRTLENNDGLLYARKQAQMTSATITIE